MAAESNYWQSLRELHKSSSLTEKDASEFMAGVTDDFNSSEMSGISRKQFLALLTASAAFAATGCLDYRDKGEIVPYAKKPEEITPGVPNFYASTCTACPQACGILIKTREGRPIKIDGNPDHPINQGKICAKGQASILNLYDPYRLRAPQYGSASGKNEALSWNHADAEILRRLEETVGKGKEIAIITRAILSPTTKNVLDDFKKKYISAKIYNYSFLNNETRKRAWQKCYGSIELPVIQWEQAKIILALESDFLGTDGMTIEQIRKFTDGRDILKSKSFNRLYCVEGSMSLTGANADYRLRLRPDAQLEFVLALIKEFEEKKPQSGMSLKEFSSKYDVSLVVLEHLTNDLRQHRGAAIVLAGEILPEPVHVAVNYLNEILSNSKLFKKGQTSATVASLSTPEEFDGLIKRMNSGQVGIVIHIDSNPVYHLPKDFGYEDSLKSIPFSISLTETDDETSRLCTYTLPINHAFESWGDYKIRTGILSLQQPIIAPLYDTRQKEAVLLSWMDNKDGYTEKIYHEYLMNRWEKEVYPTLKLKVDFKTFWYSSLHDGVVEFNETATNKLKFQSNALPSAVLPVTAGFTLAVTENYYLGDGSFANNGWLQELPHPISKIVWDNYAAISPKTAEELGVSNNDFVKIKLPQGSAVLPVFLQPGQAENFISVSLGYGRTHAGPVGSNVGIYVHPLLSKQSLSEGRVFTGAAVTKTAGIYELASTQEHHLLSDEFVKDLHLKRKIVREGTLAEYEKNPNFLHEEKTELFSIAKEVEYNGVKWAMAIDLNKCIGCNACVAGCNVENNIPIVGKEQAAKGREMQWIRIDRYYSGTDAAPLLSRQPMLCQHCDNAPCENVCPVVATTHSPDGLNQMVYNRCVGTRYCSNNCPYKVRRFNFFNWRDHLANGYYEQQPINLLQNPEVTVRSRGVMEKCTFCIQRIMEARQHAIEQGHALKGSDVKTACQEACPTTAIVFGDMNDSNSEISNYRKHRLGYHVLEELNVRPNVTYIAKLRNVIE
jgi:molybdopterin-containing oxidoreductase family iron-sulfur binding subunit